ncbi:MAG TPA: hypothetical protein VLK65_20855 [Vicinamibacteria bacterium]|nr:hypothetical protein [Vicinamibacteria bacterium]
MSTEDLKAGRLWVERRFEEIAREFGAPRGLTREDRWREVPARFAQHNHRMTYYIELNGHLKRGEVIFWGVDLEIAGTGEVAVREKLGRQIRDEFASPSDRRK